MNMRLTNLVIWMTENCNLNCDYCYEKHHPQGFVSEEVKYRVVKLFQEGQMNLQASSHTISFFGGEPLLEFDAMVDFISWLESTIPRKFNYSITTNGTLITPEIAQYLKEKDFGMLFSIDGDETAMIARSNSYHEAVAGFRNLQDVGILPEANMTFTPEQMPRWRDNIEHVLDLGFKKFNLNRQEMARYSFDEVLSVMTKFFSHYCENWYPLGIRNSNIQKAFRAIANKGTPFTSCGAGKGFVAISPKGEVYPCHHMIQMPPTKLSLEGTSVRSDMKGWWEQLNTKNNEDCQSCFIKDICHSSCPAVNALARGDFLLPEPNGCSFTKAEMLAAQIVYAQTDKDIIEGVLANDNAPTC